VGPSEEDRVATAKFCPECGTATNEAKFCPECGTSTTIGASDPEPASIASEAAPTPTAADEGEREVWRGTPDPVLSPMAAKTNSYVITNERLKVDSGTLRKRAESMELFRIKDISVKKSMTQRSRGRGDLKITSTDPSTPEITLESIQKPDEVAETLRKLVRDARLQHGVVTHERM
jgi:hypothetical protein